MTPNPNIEYKMNYFCIKNDVTLEELASRVYPDKQPLQTDERHRVLTGGYVQKPEEIKTIFKSKSLDPNLQISLIYSICIWSEAQEVGPTLDKFKNSGLKQLLNNLNIYADKKLHLLSELDILLVINEKDYSSEESSDESENDESENRSFEKYLYEFHFDSNTLKDMFAPKPKQSSMSQANSVHTLFAESSVAITKSSTNLCAQQPDKLDNSTKLHTLK